MSWKAVSYLLQIVPLYEGGFILTNCRYLRIYLSELITSIPFLKLVEKTGISEICSADLFWVPLITSILLSSDFSETSIFRLVVGFLN